jgi:DNA repair exonuclease SbcCD ATPase subunit
MREIKKDQIPNNINKKDCKVTLNFSVQNTDSTKTYTLVREAKPSRVLLFEDNIDITKSTISETDNHIIELINASSEVFRNAVIMTANNTVPFMAQKKGEKRKFIEDMLRLGVFGEMSSSIKEDINYEKRRHEGTYEKIQIHNKNIKSFEDSIVKDTKERQQRIDDLEERISSNKRDIDILRTKIISQEEVSLININEEITSTKKKIEEVTSKLNLLKKTSYKLEFDIDHFKKEIKDIQETGNVCIACNREFDADSLKNRDSVIEKINTNIDLYSNKHKSVSNLIQEENETLNNLNTQLILLKERVQKHIDTANSNTEILARISQHEKWIEYAEVDKQNILKQTDSVGDLLQQARASLQQEQSTISSIQAKLKVLDTSRFVVSEEGVKSHIIKKMLLLLNSKLNFYLSKLEAPCKCTFNEFFEEIILNDNNQECSYFNFSGGERKRIDLAVLFMFQDIRRLQSDVTLNVSMYDELFDSALDEKGSECILNLLRERVDKNNESIYIVSHNKNTVKSGIDNTIILEKRNGFTSLCQ